MLSIEVYIDLRVVIHDQVVMVYSQVNVKTQVVIGDPKYKICEAVENLHADLLVMGSRAYGRIKRYQTLLPVL